MLRTRPACSASTPPLHGRSWAGAPLLDFERAIAMTASWYTDFDAGKHPMDLTLHQIEAYIDRMRRGS